jgi:acetyl-CoA synthetase
VDGRPLGDVTSLQDDTVPGRIWAIVAAARP